MTAVRPVSQRGDAQRRGGETRNVSRSNYAANGCSVKPGGTPRTSHTATPRALCSRRGCASRSKTPLRWRAPRSLWLNAASLRALFAVHGASFGTSHLLILRVGFLFSRLPDCGPPPRCRDRFGGQAQVPRHVNFFLGRPTVDNRRFSIGTPEEARPPRGRDHFHARIRARTAYRTAFPRAPRAHAASPSPRASRLVPSRLRPFRPPRISSPRHAR